MSEGGATAEDTRYMAMALRLAERGRYTTDPNPRVGCLLVRDGAVIGSGWHRRAGEGHAEIVALAHCGDGARDATAYVTLEPCAHQGRTGPCCEALVQAGVRRVVAAMEDPDPRVSGKGIAFLRSKGLEVVTPFMAAESSALNPGFVKRQASGLPWVRCKLAMTLDGKTALANGRSKWITGAEARADVQRLRASSSAVVTGIGTVLADDPSLNVRPGELGLPDGDEIARRQPLRVVLDSRLRTPPGARVLQGGGPVLVVCRHRDAAAEMPFPEGVATKVIGEAAGGGIDLRGLLEELARLECNEVLVEAGATLAGAFLKGNLVDELVVYVSPKLIGDSGRSLVRLPSLLEMDDVPGLTFKEVRHVGSDLKIVAAASSGP